MNKGTFSIIIVPHDQKKTRTFKMPYALFYTLVGLVAAGLVIMIVFVATYASLLVKARESSLYRNQVTELTKRTEQMGELRRNLAQLRAMNLQVRQMLGLAMTENDSLAIVEATREKSTPVAEIQTEQRAMLRAIPTFWPVRGFITKRFTLAGKDRGSEGHAGIDIAVDRGTPVRAAASGEVTEAGWNDTYGYYALIDHGYGIKTLYAHADMLVVMSGERVAQGQTIAYSGNSGKSSAPHLHFEVLQDNIPVDPLKYLLQ
jgi:murein DD-endopeptidase MepM/ murein hydrolase activator NlpD